MYFNTKEGYFQLIQYFDSVHIHILVSWSDDDQGSGWKLVAT